MTEPAPPPYIVHDYKSPCFSPEYFAWRNLRQRCRNPKAQGYSRYGGRGIKVCDRWFDNYDAFLADVGRRPTPKHSIDRIDNDGHYEPGNVRWATKAEQTANRRSQVLSLRTGAKFNRLTVIEFVGTRHKRSRWRCRCECGAITVVDRANLLTGAVRSCGCSRHDPRPNRRRA